MLTTECIYDIKNSNNHPETLKDIKKTWLFVSITSCNTSDVLGMKVNIQNRKITFRKTRMPDHAKTSDTDKL